jgi:hypothetical protein
MPHRRTGARLHPSFPHERAPNVLAVADSYAATDPDERFELRERPRADAAQCTAQLGLGDWP